MFVCHSGSTTYLVTYPHLFDIISHSVYTKERLYSYFYRGLTNIIFPRELGDWWLVGSKCGISMVRRAGAGVGPERNDKQQMADHLGRGVL